MKRQAIWVIKNGETLTAKRHTRVITNQNMEDDDVTAVNHVTIIEETKGESSIEEDAEDTPPTFEEGVQATVDELKEINIGSAEDPKPICVNANLSPKEEHAYAELLKEYKDVFAWTYKEMPGLDLKVDVHQLSIRHGVGPIKQAQCQFRPELNPQIEVEVNKLIEVGFI